GSDGGIFAFGDAIFAGSMGGRALNAPVQSLVPDPDGDGYWLVASDGGIFAFHAAFHGSMGGKQLNKPVTGMVAFGDGCLMGGAGGGESRAGAGARGWGGAASPAAEAGDGAVVALVAEGGDGVVETLPSQGQHRRVEPDLLGDLVGDPQILGHVRDAEAGLEV